MMAAAEAVQMGYGGVSFVSRACGLSRVTIIKGINELKSTPLSAERVRRQGGGSNGYRLRLWKMELQRLADQTALSIHVCHFPPGTSKWNKVEHRLFSFITSNWRVEPLRDYETIVRLIAGTTTAKGLSVTCRLDRRKYPVGRKVTNAELATINLMPQRFHGEWNYTILPRG